MSYLQRKFAPYFAYGIGTPDRNHGVSAAELKRRTLTNLYNQRPTWLDNIHARLDAAVAEAYGWPADLADGEVLERLLALNLARAGEEQG